MDPGGPHSLLVTFKAVASIVPWDRWLVHEVARRIERGRRRFDSGVPRAFVVRLATAMVTGHFHRSRLVYPCAW